LPDDYLIKVDFELEQS